MFSIFNSGIGNYGFVAMDRMLNEGGSKLYSLPVVGSTFRSLDQYGDYQKMQADYTRNVGREILYPSVRGYTANAYSSVGSAANNILSGAGHTVRSLI